MKDLESRLADKVPDDCPVLENGGPGPFIAVPIKGKGVAYCLSMDPHSEVCKYCPFNKGVIVDNTKPN